MYTGHKYLESGVTYKPQVLSDSLPCILAREDVGKRERMQVFAERQPETG